MGITCFPDEKISTRPDFIKNRKIRREAVLIGDQFVCPLCFTSDYRVRKCDVEKGREDKLRYTAICNRCGIQIMYNRKVPIVNELG